MSNLAEVAMWGNFSASSNSTQFVRSSLTVPSSSPGPLTPGYSWLVCTATCSLESGMDCLLLYQVSQYSQKLYPQPQSQFHSVPGQALYRSPAGKVVQFHYFIVLGLEQPVRAIFFTILGENLDPSIEGRSSVLTNSYFCTMPSRW